MARFLYVDLRDGLSHKLLGGSPWMDAPWEQDEQEIVRRVVSEGDVGLADRVMSTTLYVPEDQMMASLADWTHGRVGRVEQLSGAAFDREDAPIILYEADARSSAAFGLDIAAATRGLHTFTRAAYAFFWVQPEATLHPIELPRGTVEHFNLLAVPASRRERLERFQL